MGRRTRGSASLLVLALATTAGLTSCQDQELEGEACYSFEDDKPVPPSGFIGWCEYDDVTIDAPEEHWGAEFFWVCEPMPSSGECTLCPAEDLDWLMRERVSEWHHDRGCKDEIVEFVRGCVFVDDDSGECCTTARAHTDCGG
jgi:hypothetical protein